MNLREAAQQALEALEEYSPVPTDGPWHKRHHKAIISLRAALVADSEREPLSDEEIDHLAQLDGVTAYKAPDWFIELARAIERAHNIGESK